MKLLRLDIPQPGEVPPMLDEVRHTRGVLDAVGQAGPLSRSCSCRNQSIVMTSRPVT